NELRRLERDHASATALEFFTNSLTQGSVLGCQHHALARDLERLRPHAPASTFQDATNMERWVDVASNQEGVAADNFRLIGRQECEPPGNVVRDSAVPTRVP